MKLRSLPPQLSLRGKRVLVRLDINLPVGASKEWMGHHGKLTRAAVGLEWLRQKGARIVLLTHIGRPNGRRLAAYSTRPVARRLSEVLGTPIAFTRAVTGTAAVRAIERLQDGQFLMLENVRYDRREEENSLDFAKALAEPVDLFLNDAFAVAHRAHASVATLPRLLPAYAGPLLLEEVRLLHRVKEQPRQPSVLFVGGTKIHTKLPMLERFLPQVSAVCLGGALATTVLQVEGTLKLAQPVDPEEAKLAKRLIRLAGSKLVLPHDLTVVRRVRKDARTKSAYLADILPTELVVDIGPETVDRFLSICRDAKTVIWNGPLGCTEFEAFSIGSERIAKGIAKIPGATTVVGGGDTVTFLDRKKLADAFSLCSTGGGAMLAFLADEQLPGLEALMT